MSQPLELSLSLEQELVFFLESRDLLKIKERPAFLFSVVPQVP